MSNITQPSFVFKQVEINGHTYRPRVDYMAAASNARRWILAHFPDALSASISLSHQGVHVLVDTPNGPEEMHYDFLTNELVHVNGSVKKRKPKAGERDKYNARVLGLPVGAAFVFQRESKTIN